MAATKKMDEPCEVCKDKNPGPLIECERCEKWLCRKCSNLEEADFTMLSQKPAFHWFCPTCAEQALTAVKTDKLIETKCKEYCSKFNQEIKEEMNTRFEEVSRKIKNTEEELRKEDEALKKQMTDLKEDIERKLGNLSKETATNSIKEIQEREWRKNNIVIFKLDESKEEEAEQRKAEDVKHVDNICSILKITTNVRNAVRLGKKTPGNTRPLRVTLDSKQNVEAIIKASRKLGTIDDATYKNLIIKNDQTPMEREETKKLLALRNKKREETEMKGEQDVWIIRRGQVVRNRQPPTPQDPPPQAH